MQAHFCPCGPFCMGLGDPIHSEWRLRDTVSFPTEMLDPRSDFLNVVRDVLDHIDLHHKVPANQSNRYDAAIAALEALEYDLAYGSGFVPFAILSQPVFWMQFAAAFDAIGDVLVDSQLDFGGEPHPAVVAIVQDVDNMAQLIRLNEGFPEGLLGDVPSVAPPAGATTDAPRRPGLSILQQEQDSLRSTSAVPFTGTTTTVGGGTDFIDHFDARHLRIEGLDHVKILHPLKQEDVAKLQTFLLQRIALRLEEGLAWGKYALFGNTPRTAVSYSLQAVTEELRRRNAADPEAILRNGSQSTIPQLQRERSTSFPPMTPGPNHGRGTRTPSYGGITPSFGVGRSAKMPSFGYGPPGLLTPGLLEDLGLWTPLHDPITTGLDFNRGARMLSSGYGTPGYMTPGFSPISMARVPSLSTLRRRNAAGRDAYHDGFMTGYGLPDLLQSLLNSGPRGRGATPRPYPELEFFMPSYLRRRPYGTPVQLRRPSYGPQRASSFRHEPGYFPPTSTPSLSHVPTTFGRRASSYQAPRTPRPTAVPGSNRRDLTKDLKELGSGKTYTEHIRLGRSTEFNLNHPLTAAGLAAMTGEDFVRKLSRRLELTNSRLTRRDLQDAEMAKRYHARNETLEALKVWLDARKIGKDALAKGVTKTPSQVTPEDRETVARKFVDNVSEKGLSAEETEKVADRIIGGQVDDLVAQQMHKSSSSSGLAVAGPSTNGKGKRSVSFHEGEKSGPSSPRKKRGSAVGDRTSILRESLSPAWSTPRAGSFSRPLLSPRASSNYRPASFRNASRVNWLEAQQKAQQERVSKLTEEATKSDREAEAAGQKSNSTTAGRPPKDAEGKQIKSADESKTPGEAPSEISAVATASGSDIANLAEFAEDKDSTAGSTTPTRPGTPAQQLAPSEEQQAKDGAESEMKSAAARPLTPYPGTAEQP